MTAYPIFKPTAPLTGKAAELTERARMAQRRLDAAVRRGVLRSGRARELSRRLQWCRSLDNGRGIPVLFGEHPHLTPLRYFLSDYGAQIDHICRPVRRAAA